MYLSPADYASVTVISGPVLLEWNGNVLERTKDMVEDNTVLTENEVQTCMQENTNNFN